MAFNLGQRIKELRLKRKLSLSAVSKSSGISMNALRRIERNLASPTIGMLYKIAEVFNVPLVKFVQENVSQELEGQIEL
jgi:XRE family transcriptional regulator of biofilm formation